MTNITQVIPFKFEAREVRTLLIDDQPWFVAADVCKSLDIVSTARALSRLDDDEKGVHSMNTLGGTQNLSTVNESGLYSLILTSRKPEAKRFKKWVTAEVLPAIRKTGSYAAANQEPVAPSLSGRRWLVYFDHDGKECVTPVASDALVMPLGALLKQMVAPNGLHISTEALFDFVEAATSNLKQRSAYQAQRLQQARQISL